MKKHLKIVPPTPTYEEKRVLPRFLISALTFRIQDITYEVSDLSEEGLCLKGPALQTNHFSVGDSFSGVLKWHEHSWPITLRVCWVGPFALGATFDRLFPVDRFFPLAQLAMRLRPLHEQHDLTPDWPNHLYYWFKGDGPLDFFVWKHDDGKLFSQFDFIFLDNYVEWKDGPGLRTGRLSRERPIESSLIEYTVLMDHDLDLSQCQKAISFLPYLQKFISYEDFSFIKNRLTT